MNIEKTLKISLIFFCGFLSAILLSFYLTNVMENFFSKNSIFLNLSFPLGFFNDSKTTPFDFIKEDQIEVYPDEIIIKVKNAGISKYAPTGSMEPVLNENSNGIRIIPQSEEDIHIGDIITFEQAGNLIVHRIIEKGKDEKGVYFIAKGDSNLVNDGKIRFKDIKYITIGVLY